MKEIREDRAFRIRRNMLDAGFAIPAITQFLEMEQKHCRQEQYRLLSCQKAALLQKLHRIQYKIDCLDHLVFVMQQEDERKQEHEPCQKQRL